MPLDIDEETIAISIGPITVSSLIEQDVFNVAIAEEALYYQDSDEAYNVTIDEDLIHQEFVETERVVVNTRFDIDVINKAEQKEIVYDSPSAGDITIYYGIAAPLSSTSDPVWLISRVIYTAPDLDSSKKFASASFDQIWDNYLSLSYN